jgi:hypothetical protein
VVEPSDSIDVELVISVTDETPEAVPDPLPPVNACSPLPQAASSEAIRAVRNADLRISVSVA